MKVGDLVVCNCKSNVWYKGKPGLLLGFDHLGKHHTFKGDPLVMYGDRTVRLTRSSLEVINRAIYKTGGEHP